MRKQVAEVIAEAIMGTEIGSMLTEDALMEMADAIYERLQKEGLVYELIEDSIKSKISNIREKTEDFLFTPEFESDGQWPPTEGKPGYDNYITRLAVICLEGMPRNMLMKDLDIDAAIEKVKNNKFLQAEPGAERGIKAGLAKIMSEMDEDIKGKLTIREVIEIYKIRMEVE
ncbi:MAG: hypothetical protein J1F02_07930 [Lachnospiraceae bacterium]|nr:hypothetical protein [Lachnospiraceae bacterium]